MRDENGFKMHTTSESHVRQMLLVGEDPKKYINDYSNQFQRDFLQLLRTSHGEKKVQLNHFYQEYISNKEHVHMNSTKWPSLTEFAKFMGREGICRVEEDDKGIHVSWIDNSPENLRRQDAIRKKERQDKGDEEREQMLIRAQIKRARMESEGRGDDELDENERELKREEGERIKLSFGAKPVMAMVDSSNTITTDATADSGSPTVHPFCEPSKHIELDGKKSAVQAVPVEAPDKETVSVPGRVSMKIGFSSKSKNVFAAAKKNALGGKKATVIEQPKKMSEAERIMREEMERKKNRGPSGFGGGPPQKKQRI